MKEANKEINLFTIKVALRSIIYHLRICKHQINRISPFESYLRRKDDTRLSNICSKPNCSGLSYEKILNHYLDEETVTARDCNGCNGASSWLGSPENIPTQISNSRTRQVESHCSE